MKKNCRKKMSKLQKIEKKLSTIKNVKNMVNFELSTKLSTLSTSKKWNFDSLHIFFETNVLLIFDKVHKCGYVFEKKC